MGSEMCIRDSTITVENKGPAQVTNLDVNDVVPTGVTYNATSISGGDSQDDATPDTGTGLGWTVNSVNSGDTVTLTFQATVDAGTSGDTITNLATHTQDQTDTDVTADDPDVDITVNNDSDVVVTKTVSDSTPDEGDTITYTITIENKGPAQVTNFQLIDNLPAGVTYDSSNDGGVGTITP